jgi:hypothetical protein
MPQERLCYLRVDIANGQSLSGAVNLAGHLLVGVVMPSAWTTANLTLQVSRDASTYNNLHDFAGNEYTIVAAASRHILLDPSELAGAEWVKVRSGTSGTPVNQGAARVLYLVVRPA